MFPGASDGYADSSHSTSSSERSTRAFQPLYEERTPYLARELDRDDWHDAERAAINAGELEGAGRPVGLRPAFALITHKQASR